MRKLIWLSISLALLATVSYAQDHHASHWSYEGEAGPSHWGDLNPEYSLCKAGQEQSPIDIVDSVPTKLDPIDFHYNPSRLSLIDNGHTIQVNYAAGSYIQIAGTRYELVQFHFHHPSEEHVAGKTYDLVIHLVHKNSDGQLAVVAVLFETGGSAAPLKTIIDHVPGVKGSESQTSVTIDANDLLPKDRRYFAFNGSLTTPPCTQGVRWFVLRTPSTLSSQELETLAKLYPHNVRPVQPLHSRTVQSAD